MAATNSAESDVSAAHGAIEKAKRGHAETMAGALAAGSEAMLDSRTVRDARLRWPTQRIGETRRKRL